MLRRQEKILSVGLVIALLYSISVLAEEPTSGQTYGPIRSGEMLWGIAGKTRPDKSVSLHQTLIALQKANPTAFSNPCNFNSLKIGKTLKVPSLSSVQEIKNAEAVAEFQRQNTEWKNRRQGITCGALLSATSVPSSPPTTDASPESPPKPVETAPEPQNPAVNNNATPADKPVETPLGDAKPAPQTPTGTEETPAPQPGETPTDGETTSPADNLPAETTAPFPAPVQPEEMNPQPAPDQEETPASPEVKSNFSMLTVTVAITIAVLILGLLGWLALREKANRTALRKKTELAIHSNQYDKIDDDVYKAGDTDVGLDLFAETFTHDPDDTLIRRDPERKEKT